MTPSSAFAPFSSFTPGLQTPSSAATTCGRRALRMVAPENVRRTEEIKKLQKQLEELRAARERIARENSASAPHGSSTPSKATPKPVIEDTFESSETSAPFELGKHGAGSRFLSLSTVEAEEYFPRILTIAGRVPELTVQDFKSTPPVLQNRAPDDGNVFITMLPPEYKGQIIAMPGLEVIAKCKDPVVILIGADELSAVKLPVAEGDDVVLLIERNTEELEFQSNKFYAWAVGDHVRVGWVKDMPSSESTECLGQVIFGMLEERVDLRKKKSCWEEENETYS